MLWKLHGVLLSLPPPTFSARVVCLVMRWANCQKCVTAIKRMQNSVAFWGGGACKQPFIRTSVPSKNYFTTERARPEFYCNFQVPTVCVFVCVSMFVFFFNVVFYFLSRYLAGFQPSQRSFVLFCRSLIGWDALEIGER